MVAKSIPYRSEERYRVGGIITPYKVLIAVVTSDEVHHELLKQGETLVGDDDVRARQVANQIALRDAIEKHGIKKVFTFHSRVASAEVFVSSETKASAHIWTGSSLTV